MAFEPMGDFTFNHLDNVDKPNKSATQNKTDWDSRASELKTALNAVVTLLNATADGASGADNIGMTPITETGTANTPQSVIEALITRLKAVTDSASGADLIGTTAITQTGTAATVQAILEALAPMTTQGDITYQGASAPARLAKGTAGQVLEMNPGATAPQWGNTKLDEHKADNAAHNLNSKSDKGTPAIYRIDSGFASGWSGVVICQKNQENLVTVHISLIKDSDITAGVQTLYTLPEGFKPASGSRNILMNLYNSSGASVAECYAIIGISNTGAISIYPVSSTNLTGARNIYNGTLVYYAV